MSFEVHITRGGDPLEGIEPEPITLAEWQAVVAAEGGMFPFAGGRPGQIIWTRPDGVEVTFLFHDKHISVGNPDQTTLRKAAELARALSAELHGEDGEEYDAFGHLAFDPNEEEDLASQLETQSAILEQMQAQPDDEDLAAIKQPWWKRALAKRPKPPGDVD
jgi:hypothetical protein